MPYLAYAVARSNGYGVMPCAMLEKGTRIVFTIEQNLDSDTKYTIKCVLASDIKKKTRFF